MRLSERDLGRFLIEALAEVVGGLAGGTPSQTPSAAPSGPQWTVTIASEGSLHASCTLAVDHVGAAALAQVAVGQDGDAAVESVLRDAAAEVISAVVVLEQAAGLDLSLRDVTKGDAAPAGTAVSAVSLTADGLSVPLHVGCYVALEPAMASSKRRPAQTEPMADERQARLDVILDIDLPVVVRFGRTEMPLRAVTRIAPGSVIDLGRSPDDPVELLVSDRVVARGEVVVVGGNYGIRIVDVVSPSERMRTMES